MHMPFKPVHYPGGRVKCCVGLQNTYPHNLSYIFWIFLKAWHQNKEKEKVCTYLNGFDFPKNLATNLYTSKTQSQETLRKCT